MADWTLLALDTPLGGSDQLSELSLASGRSMSFSLTEPSTLSFDLPGRHWQTSLIEPLVTDVLVYRDSYAVQRFRVTSMSVSKNGGELRCSYTAVSYKDLLNGWMFHPAHTLYYTATEQTAIAWDIIGDTETMTKGDIAITRGTLPTASVNRTLGTSAAGDAYFKVGARKGDAIKELASIDNGFEWDIEPDRTSTATERSGLKFNTWNAGLRQQYTPRCPFVLDDGGNVESWTRQSAPSEYANVIYVTGKLSDGEAADNPVPVAWEPSTKNPGGAAPEGRWERMVQTEATSQALVDAFAAAELDRSLAYQPSWTVDIAPGRWSGPTQMWVGDTCRLMVTDGPVDVDADARVVTITIGVSDDGGEKMSLALDRPARTYGEFRADLERRLLNLEHR